jgi:hypothetical protein
METNPDLYGLMAEFETSEALLKAAQQAHEAGYREMDAYSPFEVEGLAEAIEARAPWISYIVFAGGVLGALLGYGMQWYYSVIVYPINVGGKPYHSWPAFIPVTFELTILGAATAALLGMLILNGFPEPYHPVFNLPSFARASQDRFFLAIEAHDPKFDLEKTRVFLQDLKAVEVSEVEK